MDVVRPQQLRVNKNQRVRYIAPPVKSGIYFIQAATGTGLIKIGYSNDCEARLRSMQTGSPIQLTLLAVLPGSRKREQQVHRYWSVYRAHGEWFQPDTRLLAEIAQIQACTT